MYSRYIRLNEFLKKVRNKNKIIKDWKKRLEVKKQKLRDEIISINVVLFLLLEVKAKKSKSNEF